MLRGGGIFCFRCFGSSLNVHFQLELLKLGVYQGQSCLPLLSHGKFKRSIVEV